MSVPSRALGLIIMPMTIDISRGNCGAGTSKCTWKVMSSTRVTSVMAAQVPLFGFPSKFLWYSRLSTATWALKAAPSWNTTSSRTVNSQMAGSGWDQEVAREGARVRSARWRVRVSYTGYT